MTPSEHYQAGDLTGAIASALEIVKKAPTDTAARWQLAEFSAITGDFDRADRQLDAIVQQSPEMATVAAVFRQLIRAEISRREVFDQGRPPEFLGLPTETLSETLRALTLLRADDVTGAAAIVMGIEETRRRNPGKTGDKSFADVRDLDDLLAPVLEVLTSTGKYFWVSWDNIELLEFKKPERPRDLLWRPAHIIVRGGPDGAVYVPAIYEQTPALGDDQLRLGRSTDWRELTHGLVRGLGQRTLLVGEHDTPILECGVFEFTDAQPVNGRAEV